MAAVLLSLWACLCAAAADARAQGADFTGRPIARIDVRGHQEVSRDLLLNQLIVQVGDPYDPQRVARDIRNLSRLGRFSSVRIAVEQNPDGSVNLTYIVEEQPLLSDVQVVGNKAFADRELLDLFLLRAGDPRSRTLIDQARDRIRRHYRDAGYFLADVTVEQETLEETGILILRVREGPRVRVRAVAFEGNTAFGDAELRSRIGTRTYIFIFRKGILSQEQLDQDIARLRDYYQQRGYLDVRVGRRVTLSDDQSSATVTFLIDEGRRYTVSDIEIAGNEQFPDAQVRQAMALKVGDVFSLDRLRATDQALRDLYDKQGMIETRIGIERVFDQTRPTVSLRVTIDESRRYTVGNLIIRGNALTQDKVVRRQVRGLNPGRPFDGTGIAVSKRRLEETGIIREAKITVQGEADEEVRDVLIEVEEAQTGRLSFGAAVSSDSGVFGAIGLEQRNFDIADPPESLDEMLAGQAFRGAGQFFSVTLNPGNEFQRYQASFRDPYVFDSDYFLDTRGFFFTRLREEWDEERLGGVIGVGKRFGDVWSASVRTGLENVRIDEIDPDAPVDAFDVEGNNFVDTLGLFLTRSTVDSRLFPTRGTRIEAGVERAGVFGGDFEFTRLTGEYNAYLTVDEDFLGRKTVLRLRTNIGWIVEEDEAPLFERFYAGGHRSFRGFDFRGVGPRGIRADTGRRGNDPVGGDFLFLLGLEYNYPIWEEFVRGVFFVDTGTVQDDIGLDEYRVSVGGGLRLTLPFITQVPIAFDLAVPLLKEEDDEERVFSFDISLPF